MIENKNNSDYELENSITKLKELYSINPNRAKKEVQIFNLKLQNIIDLNQSEEVRKRNNLITLIVLSAIIALEGLLLFLIETNEFEEEGFLYYMGYVFFLVGHFMGMNHKREGLIIFFSHGVGGMAVMIYISIRDIINTPIMTDIPASYKTYLYFTLSLFVIAIIYTVAYNLSDRVKDIKYSNYIPLLIYIVAFGMTIGFNYLVK